MKAKKICSTLIKLFAILFIATALGLLLLILAYSIPVNPETSESTFKHFSEIGWNPKASLRYEQRVSYFDTFEPDVLNDGTDRIILTYSFDESHMPILEKAITMFGYGRYWHGYVVLLRPIFHFVDYWDFFLLNGMFQVSIVFILGILVWKRTLELRYPLAVMTSYLLLMPITLALSLQYTPVFYIAFLGSVVVVAMNGFLCQRDRIYLFFAILGILTCYFDFLTYPLLTWAFPLCWYLVVRGKVLTVLRKYVDVILTALTWIFGYVGFFLTKWLLIYVIYGRETLDAMDSTEAFSHLKVVDDALKVSKQTYNRFDAIYTNWRHYMFVGFVAIVLLWILWALILRIRYNWKIQAQSLPFWVITFSGAAWCFVFTGHTAIHHLFTYRVLAAGILAFVLFLCENARVSAAPPEKMFRLKIWTSLALCLAAGWGITSFAKENVYVFNGGENQAIRLAPGEQFDCSFYATFDEIRQLGLCVASLDDLDGVIHVSLQGESIAYETDFPIEYYRDSTYTTNYVEWMRLRPGTEYHMSVSVRENKSGVDLLMTDDGNMPLNEYRNSSLNGTSLGEIQLLGGIVYNTTVRSRAARMYLTFLMGIYLWMFGESLFCEYQHIKRKNA